MKTLIINNLGSGYGDGAIYDFIRSFAKDKDEICIRSTDGKTDFRHYLKDAKDFDLVVAAGGDGTVSTISYLLSYSGIPILPFPAGLTNLIAQNLFSPTEAHALAVLARNGKTMDFDIGEIEVKKNRYGFGRSAEAGFNTFISNNARSTERNLGIFAYLGAAFSNLKPQMSSFKLTLESKVVNTEGIGILLMNFSKIGMDLSLTHANRPRDGKLDIVVLKAKNAIRLIPAFTAATLDKAIDFPDRSNQIELHRSSFVKVEAEPSMEIQTDGESMHLNTPFTAKILPKAAKYVICDEGYNAYSIKDDK